MPASSYPVPSGAQACLVTPSESSEPVTCPHAEEPSETRPRGQRFLQWRQWSLEPSFARVPHSIHRSTDLEPKYRNSWVQRKARECSEMWSVSGNWKLFVNASLIKKHCFFLKRIWNMYLIFTLYYLICKKIFYRQREREPAICSPLSRCPRGLAGS